MRRQGFSARAEGHPSYGIKQLNCKTGNKGKWFEYQSNLEENNFLQRK